MFIRIKKIQKNTYAYLVENTWTKKGTRQKTHAYLGRVFRFGEISHDMPHMHRPGDFISCALHSLLENAGFSYDGKKATWKSVIVDIEKCQVVNGKKPCVLQINEGYLCAYTLKNLMDLLKKCQIAKLEDAGENVGLMLAKSIVECGLVLDGETFVELYTKLVPNKEDVEF